MEEFYTGYKKVHLTAAQTQELYENNTITDFAFNENEYLISLDDENNPIDYFCYQNEKFRRLKYENIRNEYLGEVKPRNPEQKMAIDLLQDPTTKVKLVRGVQGSGKDYLMLSQALSLIKKGKFDKIVFLRPNLLVKDLPDIGALPGTADEKLSWTLGPLFDKVGGEFGVKSLITNGLLETVPMVYIRGRSFENSIVYVTEGQNMTSAITKLLISRVSEGSELWINADTNQTDKKIFDKDNGITKMIDVLTNNELFGYVYLPTTERSAVARLANLFDE